MNVNEFGKGSGKYKPALRGAAFTNKIMAKKSNQMRFRDRQKTKIMAERAANQVGAFGGLGAHGLDFGDEGIQEIPEEEIKGSFSESAI